MTVDPCSALRLLTPLCLAIPIACAAQGAANIKANNEANAKASNHAQTDMPASPAMPHPAPAVDEFGLPLPPARADGVAGETALQRWTREAVALSAQEAPADSPRGRFGADPRGTAPTAFAAAFTEAKVPDCLRPDGLRLQPPKIGFLVLTEVLALPFRVVAKIRGKCL
jgi:hypothetical protein